ncbi:hypothetical protein [Actinoallomurus sp. NPDC050550]|uniref:hypothetical protein n=1 Tax=Actinoallomurus sp. NPDC050550 TaxID=3154937 RepID=UPI0033E195E0
MTLIDDRFSFTLSGGHWSVGQALNEVLWEDVPVQNNLRRWATRDTRLGGRHIKVGDGLIMCLAGANAGSYVRSTGSTGSTANYAHLSFAHGSHGSHGCPRPAREIAEVITQMVDRLPDMMLAVRPEELTWRTSFQVRGLVPARDSLRRTPSAVPDRHCGKHLMTELEPTPDPAEIPQGELDGASRPAAGPRRP